MWCSRATSVHPRTSAARGGPALFDEWGTKESEGVDVDAIGPSLRRAVRYGYL